MVETQLKLGRWLLAIQKYTQKKDELKKYWWKFKNRVDRCERYSVANIFRWPWIRCYGIPYFQSFKYKLFQFKLCICFWWWNIQHTDPDYSCAYVTIKTSGSLEGNGLTFTCGRGTEIVKMAANALSPLVINRHLKANIYSRYAEFWRELTSESQLRWVNY